MQPTGHIQEQEVCLSPNPLHQQSSFSLTEDETECGKTYKQATGEGGSSEGLEQRLQGGDTGAGGVHELQTSIFIQHNYNPTLIYKLHKPVVLCFSCQTRIKNILLPSVTLLKMDHI